MSSSLISPCLRSRQNLQASLGATLTVLQHLHSHPRPLRVVVTGIVPTCVAPTPVAMACAFSSCFDPSFVAPTCSAPAGVVRAGLESVRSSVDGCISLPSLAAPRGLCMPQAEQASLYPAFIVTHDLHSHRGGDFVSSSVAGSMSCSLTPPRSRNAPGLLTPQAEQIPFCTGLRVTHDLHSHPGLLVMTAGVVSTGAGSSPPSSCAMETSSASLPYS
mmetsp:Transcript_56694/g.120374  ORF Transcript_56694/g.120374 Transcript_56694/m.120374 type:complete len:217 (+) Transcript_56694:139-789(+)